MNNENEKIKERFFSAFGIHLIANKNYRWSGRAEGLYTSYTYKNMKCKIKKIENANIEIYDYDEKKTFIFTVDSLINSGITFRRLFFGFI